MTSRQDTERLVPPGCIKLSTERLLWARWDAAFAGDYSLLGNDVYTKTRNLVASFDERGTLAEFCAVGDAELPACLRQMAAHSTQFPGDAAAPFVLVTPEQPDDWTMALRESFYGRITVADGKISLEEMDRYGRRTLGFPVSAVEQVSISGNYNKELVNIRLLIRDKSNLIKTGTTATTPDRLWLLMWLLYSGNTPRSEPAGGRDAAHGVGTVAHRPDLKMIREGVTMRSEVRQLVGQFDTGASPEDSLLWARWEQVNDRFTQSPGEPYWEMINLLTVFDQSGIAAKVMVCSDTELWGCLKWAKQYAPSSTVTSHRVFLGKIQMKGVTLRSELFNATILDTGLLLSDYFDNKPHDFPLSSIERVAAARFSTPAEIKWILQLRKGGKTLTSSPVSLTASSTWELVSALN